VFEPRASLVHLLEPVGGCRPKNLADWFTWYGHNFSLFYLKNYPKPLFIIYALYYFVKLPFSALKNRSTAVLSRGVAGFFRGIRTYLCTDAPVGRVSETDREGKEHNSP
jgi:hypothetical protein